MREIFLFFQSLYSIFFIFALLNCPGPFIHSFKKYLLDTCYMSETVLSIWDIIGKGNDNIFLSSQSLKSRYK